MEALRLEGNSFASSDPQKAVECYLKAMQRYEDRTQHEEKENEKDTLEEYTKSAGNAMTCLMKLNQRSQCIELAQRALRINPIFGKANAMWGRCLVEDPSLQSGAHDWSGAFRLLCRALYQLPALEQSLRPTLVQNLAALLAEKRKQDHIRSLETATEVVKESLSVRGGKCGNGVFTTQPLSAFTLVASTLQPFSVSVYEETEGKGCCLACGTSLAPTEDATTAATTTAVIACEACGLAHYCSSSCKTLYHDRRHVNHECAAMQKLKQMAEKLSSSSSDAVPEEFFEVAFHCITTFSGLKVGWEGHEAVFRLESHAQEVVQQLHPIAPLVAEVLSSQWEPSQIATVIGIIRCNAVEVNDASGLGVGQALFAGEESLPSFFNHSCEPNCAIEASLDAIRTIRAVQPGEELTISYIPHLYWPRSLRQKSLAERYYFTCRCERCEPSSTVSQGEEETFDKAILYVLPGSRSNATDYYHDRVQMACTSVRCRPVEDLHPSDMDQMESLLKELLQHLFPFHYLCHDVRNTLTFLYSVFDKPEKCYESCLQELLLWECIVRGSLPVKQMKVKNALFSKAEININSEAALAPHLEQLAVIYDVAEEEEEGAA